MLAVFFGSDRTAVRDAASAYIRKNSDAIDTDIIDDANFVSGQIMNIAGASSLFGGNECYLLDTPSNNEEFNTEVENSLEALAESQNLFVVLEGSLLAAAKKKYHKCASELQEFTAKKAERYNTFAMADALAKKDKKSLWVMVHEARSLGIRDEEIIGILWWQLKSLRLAAATTSPHEAGMKDFPYNKAKRALSKFAPGEVATLSHSLLSLYHAGHAGVRDLDIALEKWTLSM